MAALSYRVVVTREDGQWLADLPELEGAHTYARSLPALDRYVRDLVLDFVYDVRDDSVRDAAAVRGQRQDLHDAQRELATRTERAVRRLVRQGYSVRDIAVLTGLSYQRVSQLTRQAS